MNKKEFFLISIGVFFTVIAWLIADIFHAATTEKIKSKINLPKYKRYIFNTEIFETLKNKQY